MRRDLLKSQSDGQLTGVLLKHLSHRFWVNGCKIGPEDALKMVLSMEYQLC